MQAPWTLNFVIRYEAKACKYISAKLFYLPEPGVTIISGVLLSDRVVSIDTVPP